VTVSKFECEGHIGDPGWATAIFTSPSVIYSSYDSYAQWEPVFIGQEQYSFKVILQLYQKPSSGKKASLQIQAKSYAIVSAKEETIQAKRQIDPAFSNLGIELRSQSSEDVMVKEFCSKWQQQNRYGKRLCDG